MRMTCAVLVLSVVGIASAAEPKREDFAYEAPIETRGEASVYRAALTTDIYRGVTRPDLGDLRVMNAAGEIVPHTLIRPTIDAAKTAVSLPFFPIPSTEKGQSVGDLSLQVEVGKDGSIVNVRRTAPVGPNASAYLLDVSREEHTLVALEFDWDDQRAIGLIRTLRIEASDDLKQWRTVAQGALAKFQREGQTLERKRIELPAQRTKYLRATWADSATATELRSIKGEFTSVVEPSRQWNALTRESATDENTVRFRMDGFLPVDRVRVILPPNVVTRVTVFFRNKEGDSWISAGDKTVYRLDTPAGTVVDNELRVATTISASQWSVRVASASSGAGSIVSGLDVGWIPHDLVFVARGDAPFAVTYGLAGLPPTDFGVGDLLRRTKSPATEPIDIGTADLGRVRPLKGEAARTPGWSATNWKHWLLWLVLLVGVAALAYLALRIGKQLRSGTVDGQNAD